MRFARALGLALLQLALLGLALEGLGRLFDPLGISYFPESARFFDRLIRDEPLGYRLPPGMDGRFWGARVQVNSLGMRDREVPLPKPPGERRLMLLGDSIVFSSGVEYADSIPAQLERLLAARAPAGSRWRTLNMGVPSYNSAQQQLQLETLGLRLEPDAVLLYFATNDIEPRLWVYERRANPLADCAQRSYAASIGSLLFQRLRARAGSPLAPIHYASYAEGDPRWEAVASALRQIAARLGGREIPFLVVAPGPEDAPHFRLLRALGRSAGFPVEQVEGALDPRWAADPGSFVVSPSDPHCNPRGCAILAEQLAERLERAGLLR